MKINSANLALSITLCLFSNISYAENNDCKSIKNKQKKLACYELSDKSSVQKAESATTSANIAAANEAISALKKLGANVEIGVSYREYPKVLIEAVDINNKYLESNSAQSLPEPTKHIAAALSHYKNAWEFWNISVDGPYASSSSFISDPSFINLIKNKYPNVEAELYYGTYKIYRDKLLSDIWSQAKAETNAAESALK